MAKRFREDIQAQKQGKMPKHCPTCKSSRLVLAEAKEMEKGKIIYLKGFVCFNCGYKHYRRLMEEE